MGGKETQVSIERSWSLQQSKEAICITWDPGGSIVQKQEQKAMTFEKNPHWYFSVRLKRSILRFVIVKKFVKCFVKYLNEIKREKCSPSWLKILVALSTVNLAWLFLVIGLLKITPLSKWNKVYSLDKSPVIIRTTYSTMSSLDLNITG